MDNKLKVIEYTGQNLDSIKKFLGDRFISTHTNLEDHSVRILFYEFSLNIISIILPQIYTVNVGDFIIKYPDGRVVPAIKDSDHQNTLKLQKRMLRDALNSTYGIPPMCREPVSYEKYFKKSLSKDNQTAKADEGKLQISLVPTQIIRDIAEVRMYGNKKYGDPDNWKTVEKKRYVDALLRHLLAYIDDPAGVDSESGIPHYKHAACNMAFICAMEGDFSTKMTPPTNNEDDSHEQ